MIDSLFANIDTIKKAEDTAFLSILFDKLGILLEDIGLNNNYGYHDFNFKPKKKINVYRQRFVINFPAGIIFIEYTQNFQQKFSVIVGITDDSYVNLSKLNWNLHSRNCLINIVVNNDLEYASMTINDRFNFRVESINPFDEFVSTFDAKYQYNKDLAVIKNFKFREMERYDDIDFSFDLELPPIFYMNNIQFDNHFFFFIRAFEKENLLLKELIPFVPDFSEILHDYSIFKKMCLAFAEKYEDNSSDLLNNILVLEMSSLP